MTGAHQGTYRVLKFDLLFLNQPQTLLLPWRAEALHVAVQGNVMRVWFFCEVQEDGSVSTQELEERFFQVYGTGHMIDDGRVIGHVGTTINAGFVWHVFEMREAL